MWTVAWGSSPRKVKFPIVACANAHHGLEHPFQEHTFASFQETFAKKEPVEPLWEGSSINVEPLKRRSSCVIGKGTFAMGKSKRRKELDGKKSRTIEMLLILI